MRIENIASSQSHIISREIPIPSYLDSGDLFFHYATVSDHRCKLHHHKQHQIIIIPEARSQCEITWIESQNRPRTVSLRGQYIIYISKGTAHSLRIENNSSFISLGISDDELMRLTMRNVWNGVRIVPWWKVLRHDIFIWDIVQVIRNLCYDKLQPHPKDLGGLAQAFASHLLMIERRRKPTTKEGLTPIQLQKLDMYLEEHFRDRPSVQDLASVVRLKKDHFAHLFKTATGISPHRYVMALRIRYAQRLKRIGKLNGAELAAEAGFCD